MIFTWDFCWPVNFNIRCWRWGFNSVRPQLSLRARFHRDDVVQQYSTYTGRLLYVHVGYIAFKCLSHSLREVLDFAPKTAHLLLRECIEVAPYHTNRPMCRPESRYVWTRTDFYEWKCAIWRALQHSARKWMKFVFFAHAHKLVAQLQRCCFSHVRTCNAFNKRLSYRQYSRYKSDASNLFNLSMTLAFIDPEKARETSKISRYCSISWKQNIAHYKQAQISARKGSIVRERPEAKWFCLLTNVIVLSGKY